MKRAGSLKKKVLKVNSKLPQFISSRSHVHWALQTVEKLNPHSVLSRARGGRGSFVLMYVESDTWIQGNKDELNPKNQKIHCMSLTTFLALNTWQLYVLSWWFLSPLQVWSSTTGLTVGATLWISPLLWRRVVLPVLPLLHLNNLQLLLRTASTNVTQDGSPTSQSGAFTFFFKQAERNL